MSHRISQNRGTIFIGRPKTDERLTKDFESLANAPISEGNFSVSKKKESWYVDDVSTHSEYFMLDLTTLSAVIESIPFNSNVNINSKYFTNDQLTDICNKAENGKAKYNQILNKLEEQVPNNVKNVEVSQDLVDDTTEDLVDNTTEDLVDDTTEDLVDDHLLM